MGRSRRVGAVWTFLHLALALVFAARSARATEDSAASGVVQQVLNEEYAHGDWAPARHKLDQALDRCQHGHCNGNTQAEIYIAMGMISSQVGNRDEAVAAFVNALHANPNAKLPEKGQTTDIKEAFVDAQRQAGGGAAGGSPPGTEAPPGEAPERPRSIAGWNNPAAFELAAAAVAADQVGKLDVCISKNQESLKLEEQPRTRLHLASCETRSGHLIDALGDAQKALKAGIDRRDAPVMRAARQRISDLLEKIPHVTFQPPAGATDLTVTFDERPVPVKSLTKRFSVDVGKHHVHAEGTVNALPLTFDKDYEVKEGELVTVQIVLLADRPEFLTGGQLKCMLGAKSQEDVLKCLPQGKRPLVVKAGFEINGYSDTDHVGVFTPTVTGSVSSPTAGWNIGGTYIVDVVSAASPDIVSEASPPFHEIRNAGTLTGGYKPGLYGGQATANVSSEPDYFSVGGTIAATADLRDKLLTPRLAYSYRNDTIGRTSTSFSEFHHTLQVNTFEAGATIILSPNTLVLLNGTMSFERGDQSKPYRYIPMFDPVSVAPFVPKGATIDLVNSVRLPFRPLEQLPLERDRVAVGARFVHRLGNGSLRLEQRLYGDSWQQKATTTDAQYIMDFGRRVRAWPHLRFNAQTGTNFYQLAYSALTSPNVVVPTYRTTSRELSPLLTGTVGAGARVALSAAESKSQYGVFVQGDVMYSDFLNSLFVTNATAVYGTLGFDAEFQ